jgi:hypothetical protein
MIVLRIVNRNKSFFLKFEVLNNFVHTIFFTPGLAVDKHNICLWDIKLPSTKESELIDVSDQLG